jgi:hypothetical protein
MRPSEQHRRLIQTCMCSSSGILLRLALCRTKVDFTVCLRRDNLNHLDRTSQRPRSGLCFRCKYFEHPRRAPAVARAISGSVHDSTGAHVRRRSREQSQALFTTPPGHTGTGRRLCTLTLKTQAKPTYTRESCAFVGPWVRRRSP